ncbi:type IX secretion system protein PorG [Hyunsoonleella ulvae]|uniref:type IX secretion system protein PorG n=1 Tax=Hyunsoonleella ulvae TaxID=2799948 RepID=UPI00193AAB30|nr:DUF6089 family protein [Hyunsoonleella ulvae]
MRHLNLLIISLLTLQLSFSQINEIGVFVGGSNFIGDVGATDYISPNQTAFGGIYKWNRSARHSYRVSLIYAELEGIDLNSHDIRRQQRGYSFSNSLLEVSAGMEFTFLDFNLHNGKPVATPYLYTGISVARHDNYFFFNDVLTSENSKSWAYGIPMVLGFKMRLIGNFIFAMEVGARYTFSDEIDGSVPDADFRQQFRFGNINNNDWYTFTGITLTYTFGQNPCYCIN